VSLADIISSWNSGHCTGFWDGWWGHCCKFHDDAYANLDPRLLADWNLGVCVSNSGYDPLTKAISFGLGPAMMLAVLCFGWYFYNKAKKKKRGR